MVPEFSDDYFRDLPPRDRKYDTPVADQLVFSVFPNGMKAWVHVYPCEDFVRRRTMGLFPEMSYSDAISALDVSRRIADVDSRQVRRRGKKPNMAPRTLAIALAAALLASIVTYALLKKSAPSDAVVQGIPTTATTEPATAEGADQWAEDPIFVEDAKPVEITLPDTDTETAEQTQLPSKQSPPPGMTAPQEEAAQLPSETGLEAATESVPATEDARANSPEVGSGDIAASAGETGLTTEDIGQQDEPEPATPASDSATVPSAPPDAEVAHAQLRGVTRGQLTNAVQDREPVDLVEGSLVLPPEGSVNLFYFTEIRGMTGSSVMHRWTWNGQTVSEKTFAIGGERWRIFSSRSLGGGDAGRWRTSVLDATGGEIHAIELQVEEADL